MKSSTPRRSRRDNRSAARAANPAPVPDSESETLRGTPGPQLEQAVVRVATTASTTTVSASYHDAYSPEETRIDGDTIADMNLRVLRRYDPAICSYAAMSQNVFVYEWDEESEAKGEWGDERFKGPLFVCDQLPDQSTGSPPARACLFVLNRTTPQNFVLDLTKVVDCRQNSEQKALLELTEFTPEAGDVHWGLLIKELGTLEDLWNALQARVHSARGTA